MNTGVLWRYDSVATVRSSVIISKRLALGPGLSCGPCGLEETGADRLCGSYLGARPGERGYTGPPTVSIDVSDCATRELYST